MRPIFLIGYMGSGKTTLGNALAQLCKCDFVDIDIFIESRFRKSVKTIFKEIGEDGFRRIEQSVLREVGEFQNVIIASGGGTPCFYDNMEYMNKTGITVYLETSVDCIFKRLTIPAAKAKRPLVAEKSEEELREFISTALAARHDIYNSSQLIFNSEKLETAGQIKESAEKLFEKLKEEKFDI